MSENAIILRSQVERYNLMVDFVKTVMIKERDFGIVPGTSKPTLLKPGAEKLNSLFNLFPVFTAVDKLIDWTNGVFFYQYECRLVSRQTGETWGAGLGSCNSKESKYRYRYVSSDKKPTKDEAADLKARGLGRWRKDNDKWVWMERIENDQIFDIVNTIDKMAQKRALIAATLIACNASEFFTQDVEDIPGFGGEVYEAEFTEVKQPEPVQTTEPSKAPTQEPTRASDSTNTAIFDIPVELTQYAGICTEDGTPYPLLSLKDLTVRFNSLDAALKANGLSDKDKAEKTRKRDTAKAVIEYKRSHSGA